MRMKSVGPVRPGRRRTPAAADDGPQPIIRTAALTKRYGELTAVDRLDLEVMPGEIFGLLGPNGAGKTTTILMLLGLSEPTSGKVRVAGMDPARRPLEVKRRVGYLPDNVGFYGSLSGRQNLSYTARLNGLTREVSAERVEQLLGEVGLLDVADRPVEGYSRGMRQRLGIADALVKEPTLLILDEPTIAIDPAGVAELLALIRRLVGERGIAVLLSSHLLEQVQSVCDRVGIFVEGRLVAQGRVADLADRLEGGPSVLEVGILAETERARAVLESIPGVREIEADPIESSRWLVRTEGDVRPALVEKLAQEGLPLVHLRRREEQLDAIYRRFVARSAEGNGDRVH
jgi:ABC-2 type transport system ATP-binding protein